MSNSVRPYGAPQAPLSMGFSRQEYWSGLPCNQGIFPTQGLNPCLMSLTGGFFAPSATWKAPLDNIWTLDKKCLSIHPPTFLLIKCNLNKFPICSLSLQLDTSFLTLRDKKPLKLENLTLNQGYFQRKILIKRGKYKNLTNRNLS